MSDTTLTEVANQVQTYWSPIFTKQLRASLLLGGLVDKKYDGAITKGGNTVRVSQVNAVTGQNLTIGVNADSFASEAVSMSHIDIVANKRAVASYRFHDVVDLQSQLSQENPEVLESLKYGMASQINSYLYSLVAPSTSSPDHERNSISDFNAAELATCRLLAAQAKWRMDPGWYALLDPSYYSDLMNATTLTSSDYGATDAPVIGGQIAMKRFGFNIFEDNSLSTDYAVLFHPDFLHMVSQTSVQVKISDLHSNSQFGVLMSVDMIYGAALGIDGAKKHIRVRASA